MASVINVFASPFRNTYRYLRQSAHERPVIFWSILLGSIGPVAVGVVPPVRKSFGWKPAERIPTTYPVPNRPRHAVQGYEDE
ncbi:hypothetical protein BOTBODRAFT_39079 [Botryobasidium botryosum FD-172 SS1]|uniref:NADH-ubiquinone oxidoreductase 9.5 kDa subunit n=1 Tax=Botryobasidium botryosum (strain FD-172 SS1) TaxID=930990 RepID=A0A067M5D8_BOTB1|nr:hypothetical protein BOTBODRAFT_39079 [Botryobasidium botryosum FD-172 SS1]